MSNDTEINSNKEMPPQGGVSLSAVLITLNEESRIAECLNSLSFVDEIIVVDSNSKDQTCKIAEQYGATVIQQSWLGFGAQKQFAVDAAKNDWVLCIDADEQVSQKLQQSIEQTVCLNDSVEYQAYQFPRCNMFMGRWLRHGEGYPDYSLRLFNRNYARWSDDPVHEKVVSEKEVGVLQGDLLHQSQETLDKYLEKQNRYTTLQAEQLYKNGKKSSLLKIIVSPLFRFIKFYFIKLGFLDGIPGLIHILIGCQNSFTKYTKLYERQNKS